MKNLKKLSLFKVYLIWTAILLIITTWKLFNSSSVPVMRMLNESPTFLWMMYGGLLGLYSVGAVLAWLTQKGKSWALWTFSYFCFTPTISAFIQMQTSTRFANANMPIDWSQQAFSFITAYIWFMLIWYAWKTCSKEANTNS